MATRFPYRVKATTSTTGSSATSYDITETNTPGWRTFTQAVSMGDLADGDTVYYVVFDAAGDASVGSPPKLLEVCSGTWNNATKKLSRTVIQPNGTAVNWGSGTRNVIVVDNPLSFLLTSNNLSELSGGGSAAAARANLGLGTAAIYNVGTGANNIPQLNGSAQLPAVDGSLLTNIGAMPAGQSGGTDGKIVRQSASDTWTDATNADTADQLETLCLKVAGKYYPPGRAVTGLSGLTANTSYWLGTAGAMTTTPPTPSSTVRNVYLGKALDTTTFLFVPSRPISG